MRMMWKGCAFAFVAALVAVAEVDAQVTAVQALADDYLAAFVDRNPEFATFQQLEGADHARLTDNSPRALMAWQGREDDFIDRLYAIDMEPVRGTASEVTVAYLRHSIESSIGSRGCRAEWVGVNPIGGWHLGFNQLAAVQPVADPAERSATLERWAAIPEWVRQEIVNLRAGVDAGVTAPVEAVDRVIAQLGPFLNLSLDQSPLMSPAARTEDPEFAARLAAIVEDEVLPAYEEYLAYLQNEYRSEARTRAGLVHTEPGLDCYRALVRSFTSLDEDPVALHHRAMQELETLKAQRAEILARAGVSEVREYLPAISARPENRFSSREEMLAYVDSLVVRAEAVAGDWFDLLPRGDVVVRPYPAFQEANAPGGQYLPGTADGSRAGVYMLNTSNITGRSRIGLETLTWHEGVPGHHFQLALATERAEAHALTRVLFNSGFAEGWALYAEQLADEMGLFSNDAQRLAMINSQIFRAARMVVDPGIHALGWTREEANRFMSEAVGAPPGAFAFEVDRYIAMPGQAVAYLSGRLVLERLRRAAEAALREDFDIKDFHRMVLEDGSVPLPYLEAKLSRWIDARWSGR